jgi:hypothetical protein
MKKWMRSAVTAILVGVAPAGRARARRLGRPPWPTQRGPGRGLPRRGGGGGQEGLRRMCGSYSAGIDFIRMFL